MPSTENDPELPQQVASAPAPSILTRLGLHDGPARLAFGAVALFVVASAGSIGAASEILIGAKDWVVGYFDWLFVGVATAAVLAVAFLAIYPRANVRLGPDDSRPEFSNLSWFAMLFSAGLASGLLYWSTAEPILHAQANPFLSSEGPGLGAEGVATAMRITVLHWGLHGWAFYVLAALSISIYSYRRGRPLSFRSALYPVLGPGAIDRWPGVAVDLLGLAGTVCGVATSIGIAAAAINATLSSLLALSVSVPNQIGIIFGVCVLGIASALSGLTRGIRRLSEINVWVSAGLIGLVVVYGPTLFLGGLFLETVVDYATQVLPVGMWIGETAEEKSWQSAWTVFYWGWWLAWTPFVSVFIARISKGRTVREFAIAVMLVPTLVILVWMTVFGGTALHQEMANPGAVSAAVAQDYSLGIVAVIDNLGRPAIGALLTLTAAFLLFTWLITSLDSATLVICHLIGADDAPLAKVFWGLALAAVTAVLLVVGGLEALQAASIVIGLPLAVMMIAVGVGLLFDAFRGKI